MTKIIVLAAGKGTRMNSEWPKVLAPLNERPMIKYLMDSILESGVDPKPILVVSSENKEIISRELEEYPLQYVVQEQVLGTGHAVACTQSHWSAEADNILVLNGDHPFLNSGSIEKCAAAEPKALIMMITKLPDFNEWRHNFYHWGRIIRDAAGAIARIVEFKDATEEERLITEVNPAAMCFNRGWLAENINLLDNANSQQEYYLTDLVKMAFQSGLLVDSLQIEPQEAMGINSLEELRIAEGLLS